MLFGLTQLKLQRELLTKQHNWRFNMSKAAELAKSGDTLTNQPSGRKNIVINGGMQISQRATSSTGVGNASGYFGPDRWKIHKDATTAGRLTMTLK